MKRIQALLAIVYALLPACGGPPFTTDGPPIAAALVQPDAHEDLDTGADALAPDGAHEDLDAGADVLAPDGAHEDLDAGADALAPDGAHEDLDAGADVLAPDAGAPPADSGDCMPRLGECGGKTYVGPTCCQPGLTCTFQSASFSQCL